MGDLSAIEQASAFGARDGADGHAVHDAGNEVADGLGVRQAGQNGTVCDLSGAGYGIFVVFFFAQFLDRRDVEAAADLDCQEGYGVYAGDPGHFLYKLIERLGFADAEAFRGLQRFSCGLDDFSDVFFHGICSLDGFYYCAHLGVNCPQGLADFLAELVVCFDGFGDGAELVGLTGCGVTPEVGQVGIRGGLRIV